MIFKNIIIPLISGLVFGIGLFVSGMTNPEKVIGFLNILSGEWDPSLAFVMGGAMLVTMPVFYFVNKKMSTGPLLNKEEGFFQINSRYVDHSLILGTGLFGIGWGLVGFCPGPVLTSALNFNPTVLTFIAAMTIGMLLRKITKPI